MIYRFGPRSLTGDYEYIIYIIRDTGEITLSLTVYIKI